MNPLTNVRNIQNLNKRELESGVPFEQSWHQQYKESAWIFIGGLDYDLTEGDLICLFSQYGEVANINLVRDKKTGKSKGFAFICYENQLSTVLSVDNLNSIKLCGRTIRVDHVEEYRVPRMREDMAPEQQQLALEGCAPVLTGPPTPEHRGRHEHAHRNARHHTSSRPSRDDHLAAGQSEQHNTRPGCSGARQQSELKEERRSPDVGVLDVAGPVVDGVLLPPRLFGVPINEDVTGSEKSSSKSKKRKHNKKDMKCEKVKKEKKKKKKKKNRKRARSNSASSSSSCSSDDSSPPLQTSSRPGDYNTLDRDARRSAVDEACVRVKAEPPSDRGNYEPLSYPDDRRSHSQRDPVLHERRKSNDRPNASNRDQVYESKRPRDEKGSSYDSSEYFGRRRRDHSENDVDADRRHGANRGDRRERSEYDSRKRFRKER